MATTKKQKWEGKQLYGRFKRLINISHQKSWTWLRKGYLKRETESLLIAAQDITIRTNHIKARLRRNDQSHNKRMQQISTEGVQGETRLGCAGNFSSSMQTNGICTTEHLS